MNRPLRDTLLAAAAFGLLLSPGWARPAEAPAATPAPAAAAPAAVPAATAATVAAEPPRPEGRELAGHLFMPTLGIRGPFSVTNFGTFLTVGQGSTTASVTLTLPDGSTKPIGGSVDYVAIGGILSYQYEFVRGVSARLGLSESLYSGTTGTALAVVGTNVRLGLDAGLTAGLTFGDSLRVAAVIDASSAPRMGLKLGAVLEGLARSCQAGDCVFDLQDLFNQQNVLTLQPGVAAGWAPHKSVGVTANLSYSWSSIAVSNKPTLTTGGVVAGAAVDFDFMGVSKVPVGLQLTWASLFPVSGDTSSQYTDVGGGLFYTGQKDLSLGLQLFVRRFKVVPEVEVSWTTVLSQIGLRYFW
jgi:hypothetical protein